MKTKSLRRNRVLSTRILPATCMLLAAANIASAVDLYWDGVAGNWDDLTKWSTATGAATPDPGAAPGATDLARFNITTAGAGVNTFLNGDRFAQGLVFGALTGTTGIRGGDVANAAVVSTLTLGAGGIVTGATTNQLDLGGGGVQAFTIKLAASQSWTSAAGIGTFQSFAAITNAGDLAPVTLTIDGAATADRRLLGVVSDGGVVGTTAILINVTGAGGGASLANTANTFSGGTTLTAGTLLIGRGETTSGSGTFLGTGSLTINGGTVSSAFAGNAANGFVGGVTNTGVNAMNWNANFTLGGAQNINFGTGAITMNASRQITLNAGSNAAVYTFGGNISGAGFGLTIVNQSSGLTNAMVKLDGTNTYDGGTNINQGLVRFGSVASIPAAGTLVLNGGAISVSGAYSTLAGWAAAPNFTRTAGAFALVADSSEAFTPNNGAISLGAQLGTTVKYTGALTPVGNYQTGGGAGTIVFTSDSAFTGVRAVVANGNGGGGTVIIKGQNNFAGSGSTGVNINAGTLEVSSINSFSGGTATSNLGAPSSLAAGTLTFGQSGGAVLRYTGVGETTDRPIVFTQNFGASMTLDASGTGALAFSGTYAASAITANAVTRTLNLRGISTESNSFAGAVVNGTTSGTGTMVMALTKSHRGNWNMTGASTLTGAVTLAGGTLTLDYASNASLVGGGNAVAFAGGTLAIKGNPAGGTVQTLGALSTTLTTGESQLTVTGNNTAGSAILTIGNTWTRNASTYLNINLANGGSVSSSPALSNGAVVGTGTIAAFTVTDSTGTDYATVSGGSIVKLAAATALPATGSTNTTNYSLSGDLTLGGAAAVNTLRIDTSSAAGTLTLGANNVTVARSMLLMSGANDYTIAGTQIAPAGGTLVLSNYGSGKLTVNAAITSAAGIFQKTGPGLLEVTAAQAYTGSTSIFGGVLRLSNTAFGTSNITLGSGGILEIGADLNGGTAGDFSRLFGTGASQIQWAANGDGGFSAFGGNRVVNLGGTGTQLVWASISNGFTTVPNGSPQFIKDGYALLLSSSTSDSTITLQNALNFVNVPRAVVVGNGSAAVDAVLSGVLSSSDYSGGLDKSGTGTLALTAANTFTGATRVLNGTLQLGNAGTTGTLAGTSAITISSGASLTFNRTNALAQTTDLNSNSITGAGSVTQAGSGTTTLSLTNTYTGGTTGTAGVLLATVTTALPGYNLPGKVVFNAGTVGAQVGGLGWTTGDVDTLLANGTKTAGALGIDTTNGDLTQWTPFTTTNFGPALGLTKLGANTLTLDQANNYEGVTKITTGKLAISDSSALGTTAGNTVINVTGSTLTHGRLSLNNNITVADNIVLQGSGLGGNEGNITATGGVNHLAGTVTLTGNNGYRLDASGVGTVLNYDGQILDTSAGATQLYVSGATSNFNASIDTNGGGFFAHGAVSINATGNDIGNASVQYSGNLKIGITDALVTTKNLVIGLPSASLANGGDVGTFNLQGFNQTVSALNGFASTGIAAPNSSRKITNSAAATTSELTVGTLDGNSVFNGDIENGLGTVNVEKIGLGTLDLNGAQNYSLLTTTGGITNVNGAFTGGTATVNANAETNFTVSQGLDALNIGTMPLAGFSGGGAGVAAVPEPGSAVSLISGLGLLLGLRRRRS